MVNINVVCHVQYLLVVVIRIGRFILMSSLNVGLVVYQLIVWKLFFCYYIIKMFDHCVSRNMIVTTGGADSV